MGLLDSFNDMNDPDFSQSLNTAASRGGSMWKDATRIAEKMPGAKQSFIGALVGAPYTYSPIPGVPASDTPADGPVGRFFDNLLGPLYDTPATLVEKQRARQNPFNFNLSTKIILGVVSVLMFLVWVRK